MMKRWQSGLMHLTVNQAFLYRNQGFESPSFEILKTLYVECDIVRCHTLLVLHHTVLIEKTIMSVNYYDYICPECGHVEHEHGEELMLFGDYYMTYVCRSCNKLYTKAVFESKTCEICGRELVGWNHECPKCGTPMTATLLYSDVI